MLSLKIILKDGKINKMTFKVKLTKTKKAKNFLYLLIVQLNMNRFIKS